MQPLVTASFWNTVVRLAAALMLLGNTIASTIPDHHAGWLITCPSSGDQGL